MNTVQSILSDKSPDEPVKANIGSILRDNGKISSKDEERIIALQKQKGLLFGDAAKALGLINESDIQKSLSYQFDFPLPEAKEENFDKDLYAVFQPFSEQVESLRSLRAQLLLHWFGETNRSLTIASHGRGEGRSSLAANLAIVFSQLGERTLLLDADLRQPRQQALFKLEGAYGLSDILVGRADQKVLTKIPGLQNLSILQAGTKPPNPSELISRGLKGLLLDLKTRFDVILIDTPATGQSMDSQVVASMSGDAILLARQNHTRLNDLKLLKTTLRVSGCECLGAVLANF